MSKKNDENESRSGNLSGILEGLTDLVQKLSERSAQGGEHSGTGGFEFGGKKGEKGVFGFSVKIGLGTDGVKVEPFGNLHRDEKSGETVVQENREPVVDVFEEDDYTLVVAEMPGISVADVKLEIKDDLLTIHAEKGDKRYQKEILLPKSYSLDNITMSCNNGILEIRCSDVSSGSKSQ